MEWQVKKLDEICEVFADGDWIEKKDQSTDGIRLIQTGNIGNGYFLNRDEKARYISDETFERLRCAEVLPNDCLLSRLPDPVGRACLIPDTKQKMITAVDCTIMRFKKDILPKWFIYYSLSNNYQNAINNEVSGATRQRISRSNLGNIKIPIPTTSEQKRIVAILDEAFTAVDKAKENTEKNLQNVQKLFSSYLQAVFVNKGKDWIEATLGEITLKIGSGATPRGGNENYKTEGIFLIRSMNVHDFEFRDRNIAFIDEKQAKELNNVTLQENDILLNITGASVARCCILPRKYLPARVNQHVSIIRVKKEIIDPFFLNLLLTSKFYKDQLLFTGEQGATRQAITKAQLESFKLVFPETLKEQQAIVQKIDSLSAETNKLEAIYQQKLDDLEELKKSILQKAFNGELAEAHV